MALAPRFLLTPAEDRTLILEDRLLGRKIRLKDRPRDETLAHFITLLREEAEKKGLRWTGQSSSSGS